MFSGILSLFKLLGSVFEFFKQKSERDIGAKLERGASLGVEMGRLQKAAQARQDLRKQMLEETRVAEKTQTTPSHYERAIPNDTETNTPEVNTPTPVTRPAVVAPVGVRKEPVPTRDKYSRD